MRMLKTLAFVLAAALPLGAQAARPAPIKSPVEIAITQKASAQQVKTAAQVAAQSRGWEIQERKGNSFEAVYAQQGRRSFSARIRVTHSAKAVTVEYVTSEGLDYNPGDKTINANFNKWMDFLERDIPTFLGWIVAAE